MAANPSALAIITNPSASFSRPANTTAYASGDLVANSTTAGSVTPLSLTVTPGANQSCFIRRCKLHKSGASITSASFRVHLYRTAPTPANGDNGAFSTSLAADYLGAMDVTIDQAFTDGAAGFGAPNVGSEIAIALEDDVATIKALIEARDGYTPASGETFTLTLETYKDG